MAYCKWCGMDSRDSGRCEWCGRDLGAAAQQENAPPPAHDYVASFEDENRALRTTFYLCCIGLILVTLMLTAWRFLLLPWATVSALFVTGILLGALRILPAMEDEWHEFVVPLVLILVLGPEIVFIGYLVYGLVTKAMDLTVVWLLSSYFAVLLLIQVMALILAAMGVGPERVPITFVLHMRVTAVLGLVAILFGWGASGMFRRLDR